MSRIISFGRFLWGFVVGDDWRSAAAVVVALAVTALVGGAGWWILPLVVAAILAISVLAVADER